MFNLVSDHSCCKPSTTVVSPLVLTVVNKLRCSEPVVHNHCLLCWWHQSQTGGGPASSCSDILIAWELCNVHQLNNGSNSEMSYDELRLSTVICEIRSCSIPQHWLENIQTGYWTSYSAFSQNMQLKHEKNTPACLSVSMLAFLHISCVQVCYCDICYGAKETNQWPLWLNFCNNSSSYFYFIVICTGEEDYAQLSWLAGKTCFRNCL